MIADLLVQLVRMQRRDRRQHERNRSLSSSGYSYRSFCGRAWSGEGSQEDPILEREAIIHVLILEENNVRTTSNSVAVRGLGCSIE